jgi:hypothetical protein
LLTFLTSLVLMLGIQLQALSPSFDQPSSMTKVELWSTAAFRQDRLLSTTLAPLTLLVELARTSVKMFPKKSIPMWELASRTRARSTHPEELFLFRRGMRQIYSPNELGRWVHNQALEQSLSMPKFRWEQGL